jgi:hypothetical protein
MHYPPNDAEFGKTNEGLPDFGQWSGEFKVGFRLVGEELVIERGEMYFTATPKTPPRNPQLVFKVKNDTYTITYDITKTETFTIKVNDNEPVVIDDVRQYLREHNISLRSLKDTFGSVGIREFTGNNGRLGNWPPNDFSNELYINRLEMLNAIPLLDLGETIPFDFGPGYELKYEGENVSINNEIEGNKYVVRVNEQQVTILIQNTEGNDVPLICFNSTKEADIPSNIERIYDDDGRIWIVASRSNFDKINDAYTKYTNQYSKRSDFWVLNRVFFGGQ